MCFLTVLDVVSNRSRRDLDWNFLVLALSSTLWYESWGCLRDFNQMFWCCRWSYRQREIVVHGGFLDRIRVEGSHKHLKKETKRELHYQRSFLNYNLIKISVFRYVIMVIIILIWTIDWHISFQLIFSNGFKWLVVIK